MKFQSLVRFESSVYSNGGTIKYKVEEGDPGDCAAATYLIETGGLYFVTTLLFGSGEYEVVRDEALASLEDALRIVFEVMYQESTMELYEGQRLVYQIVES